MCLGYGRRLLARIVEQGNVENTFSTDPYSTAYNIGLNQTAKSLNTLMREVNSEAWLIMQREMLQDATDDS